MKLIIDIPEEHYRTICDKYGTFPREMKEWGLESIKNGTPIPDNATNGDVITEILKSSNDMHSTRYIGLAQEDTIYIEVGSGWWNSPYESGEQDG
jgi:hypothetical protein